MQDRNLSYIHPPASIARLTLSPAYIKAPRSAYPAPRQNPRYPSDRSNSKRTAETSALKFEDEVVTAGTNEA